MKPVRYVTAALLAALAVPVFVTGWRWPLEGGGLLFAPLLFGLGAILAGGALALVVPRRPRPRRPETALTGRLPVLFGCLGAVALVGEVVRWVS